MKYQSGQTVILLDTQYKPVGHAVIKEINRNSYQYFVSFLYPGSDIPEDIWVPQDRLTALEENANTGN